MEIDHRRVLADAENYLKKRKYEQAIVEYERVAADCDSHGLLLRAVSAYKQIRKIIAEHAPHLKDKYAHIAPRLVELYERLGLTSDAQAILDELGTRPP
jgi:hypothetical protein